MRKKVGIIKRTLCLGLVFLLSINSFAAIVSDNDGSAFITKAEFDALKNSFQSQIDSYNNSIDSKIDGAIASYLSGIKLSTTFEPELITTDWVYFKHPDIWLTKARCTQAFLTNFVETKTWSSGGALVDNSSYVWHIYGCTKYTAGGVTNQIQNISVPTNTSWETSTTTGGSKGHLLIYSKGQSNSYNYLKEWHQGQVNRLAISACTMDGNDKCTLPKTTTVTDAGGSTHEEFDTRTWQWTECNWDAISAQYFLGEATNHDFTNIIWNNTVDTTTNQQYARDEDRYYILDEKSTHYEHGSGISGCQIYGKQGKNNYIKVDTFNWKSELKNWDDLGSYVHRNFKVFVGICDGLVVCKSNDAATYTVKCQSDTDGATIYIKNAAFNKCAPSSETLTPLTIVCKNNCSVVAGKVNAIKITNKNTSATFEVTNPTKAYLYLKSDEDIGIKIEEVAGKKSD